MLQFSKRFLCATSATTATVSAATVTTSNTKTPDQPVSTTTNSTPTSVPTTNTPTKIKEICKRVGIISKLEEFKKQNDDDGSSSSSDSINLYSAISFTPSSQESPSQREAARYFANTFTKRLNHEINLPTCVISVEQHQVSSKRKSSSSPPFKFNTRRLHGSIEEVRTIKKVNEVLAESRKNLATGGGGEDGKSQQQQLMKVKQNVVVLLNDSLIVVPSSQRKHGLSLTYAQNNNVVCAMRRSFDMLESFRNSSNNISPPCFFISKILRSAHMNTVTKIASKYFDHVHLLTLNENEEAHASSSKSQLMERYLVGEMNAKSTTKKIYYRDLSLPPDEGEAFGGWMCWGCLQWRDGRMLRCPKCSK